MYQNFLIVSMEKINVFTLGFDNFSIKVNLDHVTYSPRHRSSEFTQ